MSHVSHYRKGLHLFTCQRCGCVFHSDKKKIEWTGAIVCGGPGSNDCFEPRHPQDFVRGVEDKQSVDNPAPEPPDGVASGSTLTWDDDSKAWS